MRHISYLHGIEIQIYLSGRKKVSQIEWAALYNNEAGQEITTPDVERLFVTGGYGIYGGITAVLIDYLENGDRNLYFVCSN